MFFVEDANFLTDGHKEYIESVRKADFPYFYQQSTVAPFRSIPFQHMFLTHVLIPRPDMRVGDEIYSSVYAKGFEDMLTTFCDKNKVEYNETLRASINLTFNNLIF